MIIKDRLKLFKTEEEIRQYAKINGYDEGGTDLLVKAWTALRNKQTIDELPEVKSNNKIGIITDIEEK